MCDNLKSSSDLEYIEDLDLWIRYINANTLIDDRRCTLCIQRTKCNLIEILQMKMARDSMGIKKPKQSIIEEESKDEILERQIQRKALHQKR